MKTIKPEILSDSVTLYEGDCLDVLPTLTGVDCIIADVPYGEVNRKSSGLRNLDKGNADIETFDVEYVSDLCYRISNTTYIFCGIEQVSVIRKKFVSNGFSTRLCVWEKSNPSPMNGENLWLSSIECCVFGRKKNSYFGEHCASAVWRGPVARNQIHPTQKPTWLFKRLIKASCPSHGTVVDFCAGSGTTGVAAILEGRKAILIEKDPKYCDIIRRRIAEAEATGPDSLFKDVKQHNLFND